MARCLSSGWSMLIGGLILLPFYARQGTNFVVNGSLILAFFYLIVIGTSLTFRLYLKGAQLIGGPKASILSCAEPLSSALLSSVAGDHVALPDWLGTLLILSSVILTSMDSRRRARKINRPARISENYQPGTAPPLKMVSAALATSDD